MYGMRSFDAPLMSCGLGRNFGIMYTLTEHVCLNRKFLQGGGYNLSIHDSQHNIAGLSEALMINFVGSGCGGDWVEA